MGVGGGGADMDSAGHSVLRTLKRRGLPILRLPTSGPSPRASGGSACFCERANYKGT